MRKTILASAISAAVLASVSLPAMSYEQGDIIVRAGATNVSPNDSSSHISVEDLGGRVPGTGVGVGTDTQLGLTVSYMLSDKWGIELLAATPFEHDLKAEGLGDFGISDVGTVEHLPPTISLQYYLMNSSSVFQPYIGLGVNYTLILDEELSSEMKDNLGARDMDIDNSLGLSVQLGFDYALNDKWLVNAAVWRVDIDTTADMDSDVGKISVDVDIDPWVYMLSVGYKF